MSSHKISGAEQQFELLNSDVENGNSSSAEKILQEIGLSGWPQYNQYLQKHSLDNSSTEGYLVDSTSVDQATHTETLTVGNIVPDDGNTYDPVVSLTVKLPKSSSHHKDG